MSVNEPEKPKKRWGCLQLVVAWVIVGLLICAIVPASRQISPRWIEIKARSNARQIVGLLLTYASDHNGKFPDANLDNDGLTSNAVFRELVKEGLVLDETIFGCPYSRFIPDKNIGTFPDYKQALEPGENHWMMVAGLDSTLAPSTPLVLENAVEATWPPRWLPNKKPSILAELLWGPTVSMRLRGGSWAGNLIIVSHLDASASAIKLEDKAGYAQYPSSLATPSLKLLDIEEKP